MFPADFDYARARSVEHALALLDRERGRAPKVIAGGQSLLPMMKLRLASPALLVDIGGLGELKGVTALPGTALPGTALPGTGRVSTGRVSTAPSGTGRISVGALTTYRELQRDPGIARAYPAIADALAVLADPQVRARGTIGGSVAHGDPAADLPAVLLALGAEVEIAGRCGGRTVPLARFLLGVYTTDLAPDEIVTAVTLPRPAPAGMAYEKFEQPASRLPLAGVCAVAEVDHGDLRAAMVAVTGVAARAFLCPLEDLAPYTVLSLLNKNPVPVREAGHAIAGALAAAGMAPLSDQHASGPFRVHLAGVLACRALARAIDRATGGAGAPVLARGA